MSSVIFKNLPEVKGMLLAIFSLLIGCFIGSFVNRFMLKEYEKSKDQDLIFRLTNFDDAYNSNSSLPKIFVPSNPRGAEKLPPRILMPYSDLFHRECVGNAKTQKKPKYLLTLAVGIHQKEVVNKMVSKFSDNFTIVLFHYDGQASDWDEYEWSQRATHISAIRQTKWWYVKRFLHPNIVSQYDYIFIWDEDFGLDNFDPEEYIKVVKKYGLEISQPAVTSTNGLTYKMTLKRPAVEVHWQAVEDNCPSLFLPPCAGFVEIMAPVFSRNSWNCIWNMIQNDLVHGWGLDFAFYKCVENAHERIGVVDSQWIHHLELPTLSSLGESINGRRSRHWVRSRSYKEMVEFKKRLDAPNQSQV